MEFHLHSWRPGIFKNLVLRVLRGSKLFWLSSLGFTNLIKTRRWLGVVGMNLQR